MFFLKLTDSLLDAQYLNTSASSLLTTDSSSFDQLLEKNMLVSSENILNENIEE